MSKEIKILGVIALLVIIGAIVGANYYRNSQQSVRVTGNSNSNSAAAIPPETLVRADSPTLGAPDAKITLVEFLDPECESCAAFSPVVKKILKDYDGRVRLVVRYMPLHPNSMLAATYTEAAGEQGKYWQMHDLLFSRQAEWGTRHGPAQSPQPNAAEMFEKYAKEMGLDMQKVNAAVKENRFQAKLNRDLADGRTLGVRQTPSFFVNGRKLQRFGEADLRALIEDELK